MRRLAGILALLLLVTSVAPMLACVTGAAMSREEHACCRNMQGHCGPQMARMKDMGCCRTEVSTGKTSQTAASPAAATPSSLFLYAPHSQLATAILLVAPPALHAAAAHSPIPILHSPPGLITVKTSVLRI